MIHNGLAHLLLGQYDFSFHVSFSPWNHEHLIVLNLSVSNASFLSVTVSQEEEKFLETPSNKLAMMSSGKLKLTRKCNYLFLESVIFLEESWSWQVGWALNVYFVSGTRASLNYLHCEIVNLFLQRKVQNSSQFNCTFFCLFCCLGFGTKILRSDVVLGQQCLNLFHTLSAGVTVVQILCV